METLEVVQTFTRRGEEDRSTRHATHGKRGTASGITIELGEHDSGETNTVTECGRGIDRILTNHGVKDKHDFVRIDGLANSDRLIHHLLIDTQTARGIDDHNIDAMSDRIIQTGTSHLNRITDTITRFGCPHLNARALTDNLKLADSIGALKVRGNKQNALSLFAQPLTKLSGQSRLTCTLQTCEHENCRASLGKMQLSGFATQDLNKFIVNNADNLLTGVERAGASRSIGLLANLSGELTNDRKGDVGIDQGTTNLANSLIDIRFRQDSARTEPLKGGGQTIRKIRESHCDYSSRAQFLNN